MTTRKSTRAAPAQSRAYSNPDLSAEDRITSPLVHARAVLDVLYTLAGKEHLVECLRDHSLQDSLHDAIERIDEALRAVEQLPVRHEVRNGAGALVEGGTQS